MNLNVISLIFKILMILTPVWDQVLELIDGLRDEDRKDLRAAVDHISSLPTFRV